MEMRGEGHAHEGQSTTKEVLGPLLLIEFQLVCGVGSPSCHLP